MLPLLACSDPKAVFAHRKGEAVTIAHYLEDVHQLASRLPASGHIVNYCQDRYRFTVGFGAALLKGAVTLLPSSAAPGVMEQLAGNYPDACVLTDVELPQTKLVTLPYPEPDHPPSLRAMPAFPAGQTAAILFTSGSTGAPQAHPRRWGALVHSARAAGARLLDKHLQGAVLAATVPHQHSYGLESAVMLALQNGLVLDDERPLLPADIAARMAAVPRPVILVTTPVHLKALLTMGEALPRAGLILSATAPLAQQLALAAEQAFGCELREIYGCSEAGQIATRRTAVPGQWHCLAGVSLEKTDAGTIPHGLPVAAELTLPDVIELNSPVRFLLHGRMADLVNIAGKRSSLAHLTFRLNAIPGVKDGVFLMPENDEQPHRLMALVVAPGLDRETILTALRHDLDPAFLPRPLIMVEALPRNELGKLPREALLELARAGGRA
jgi:acyl-coenzyme A synthetase/AMP-(fatty) acid ligase